MLPRDVLPAVKASCIGAGTAIAIATGISAMFLYAAYGLPIVAGASIRRMAHGSGLEPWPLLVSDAGQHRLAVHGRGDGVPGPFAGPVVQGARARLTEIELESQRAAAEPQGGTAG